MVWHLQTAVTLLACLHPITEGQAEDTREDMMGQERETRSILGGERTEFCPAQCLCLSEIQVLCNTGSLSIFPPSLPNVTQDISITNQKITVVPKYAFKGLKHLKKITLDHNKIITIEPFAFKGITNIEEISLRWNPIETISGFAFAGIRNVSQIYLGYNKIHTISGYAFAGSEHFSMLVINDNPIKTIDSFAFAGLKQVKFLLVSSSVRHLHEDAFNGLETVEHLKLDFLNLVNTVPYSFRGLQDCKTLTIDNSDLGTVQPRALAGMIDVKELKVINSKIDKVVDSVINEDTQIKHLTLDGNHLLAIPPQFDFMSLTNTGELKVVASKNHIPCSCSLLNILDSLMGYSEATAFFQDNFCVSPLEFNGQPMIVMLQRCKTSGQFEVTSRTITKIRKNKKIRERERKKQKLTRRNQEKEEDGEIIANRQPSIIFSSSRLSKFLALFFPLFFCYRY